MADGGKKKISIDMEVNIFGECKGRKAPEWFAARPKLLALVKDIPVKETMELDPRKWDKKKVENGVYAVARYELAVFSTALANLQKDIDKAIPKAEQKNKKFKANDKTESKEEGAALSAAETKVKKLYARISKGISDKVSLALEELASDKGDNKKALADGKKAIGSFKTVDAEHLFDKITDRVVSLLEALAEELKGDPDDKMKAEFFKQVTKDIGAEQTTFSKDAKTCQNVIKFLLDTGEKMSKNKDAHEDVRKFGERISKSNDVKKTMKSLDNAIGAFDGELTAVAKAVSGGKMTTDVSAKMAKAFRNKNKGKDKDAGSAVALVKRLSGEFNKLSSKMK